MTISPMILLIIYLVGVAVFLTISLLGVYHIVRFSFSLKIGMIATLAYFGLAAVVVILTLQLLSGVNWRQTIDFNLPFSNQTNEFIE